MNEMKIIDKILIWIDQKVYNDENQHAENFLKKN